MPDWWRWFPGTVVALATWLTPMQGHHSGWIINYGGQTAVEANADYRGYDLGPYRDRCGLAAMSPANLGGIVWLRAPGGHWFGPCLVIDTASRVDYYRLVYEVGDIAEIPRPVIEQHFGTSYGLEGEAFFGPCPPSEQSAHAAPYAPRLRIDPERPVRSYCGCPYPDQQMPIACESF